MLNQPSVTKIYRGFLLAPSTYPDEATTSSVEYQLRYGADDTTYSDWESLGASSKFTKYQFIHDSLYADIFYEYRYRLKYSNNTYSDWSDYAIPGNGQLLSASETNVQSLDQLAASLGTITAGYMRGVIFETSANYPKVRMDPTGFYSITATATPVVLDAATGDLTLTGGTIRTAASGQRVQLDSTGLRYFDTVSDETLRLSSGTNGLQLLASTTYTAPILDRSISWSSTIAGGTEVGRVTGFLDTGLYGGSRGITLKADPTATSPAAPYLSIIAAPANSTFTQRLTAALTGNAGGTKFAKIDLYAGDSGVNNQIDLECSDGTDGASINMNNGAGIGKIIYTGTSGHSFQGGNVSFGGWSLTSISRVTAGDGVATKPVAGVVSDGSFSNTPTSGTIAVDTTNSRLYVRVGSTWKSVALT